MHINFFFSYTFSDQGFTYLINEFTKPINEKYFFSEMFLMTLLSKNQLYTISVYISKILYNQDFWN